MEKFYMPNTQRIMRKRLRLQREHTSVRLRVRNTYGGYDYRTFMLEGPINRPGSLEMIHPDDRELVPDWLFEAD